MLQLFYHFLIKKLSTSPFFKIYLKIRKHITLLTYLLPCPAARVPVTSSRYWGTVGHLALPSTACRLRLRNWRKSCLCPCVRAKEGQFELLQYDNWVNGYWFSETMFQIHRMCFSNRLTIITKLW